MLPKDLKLFGTDGIRAEANVEPMSADTILRVGRAAACVFLRDRGRRHRVLIGKDTRLSGYMFETALAAGFCSMGVDVVLLGPVPTPAIAFLSADARADAGVVISASHNPYNDNGIKFFGPDGFKLADDVEASIEALVRDRDALDRQRPAADQVGMAQRLEDARGRYITFLKRNFPKDLSLDGVRLVIDCANGATYRIAPAVFQELGASVELIGVKPDGKNINEACGAVHPEGLASRVKETGAQAGVAFDGDGDRVVVCDGKGRIFDGDDILAILAGPLKDSGELGAGVVGTVMTNFGLERHFADRGIAFHRAPVGDRYVVEKMRETGALLGGEPSGHIVSLARSTTGDGILTALLLMAVTVRAQKPLAEFAGSFRRYPQELRNVRVRERKPLEGIPAVAASIRSGEERLKGSGRVLVRYSGTEAKARVMVEGENADLVREIAAEIEAAIRTEIGGS